MDLTACPECGLPAEVKDRRALPSTDGPVEHARVLCIARHTFLLPTAMLVTPVAAAARRPGRPARGLR